MFSMDFLVKEFLFDCKVRSLSEQTILNYKKQLGHFVRFLKTNCQVTNIEDLKPLHIKLFIRLYQERQCKPSYVNDNLKFFQQHFIHNICRASLPIRGVLCYTIIAIRGRCCIPQRNGMRR